MKSLKKIHELKVGDKVTFDSDKLEFFKAETSGDSREIRQYQRLVIAGIDQVGIVKGVEDNLTTVAYKDGWELPIPTKYLVVLPQVAID